MITLTSNFRKKIAWQRKCHRTVVSSPSEVREHGHIYQNSEELETPEAFEAYVTILKYMQAGKQS